MQEETLLELYFSRSERALEQTKQQYGTYCYAIAYRILAQPQDAEECENETRIVFVQRYWYLNSIAEIAQKNGIGESKVKMLLLRTRKKLKAVLETEGISI